MIRMLMHISWLNLKRDRIALFLTFIMPIVFFSIFAMIFGSMSMGGGGGADGSTRVLVVDNDQTEISARFIEAVDGLDAISVRRTPKASEDAPEPDPYTRDSAKIAVRDGVAPIAMVIPEGFGANFGTFMAPPPEGEESESHSIELLYDESNPIALFSTKGLMQAAAMQAAPDVLMTRGLSMLEEHGGPLTPAQRLAVDLITPALKGETNWPGDEPDAEDAAADNNGDQNDADATSGGGGGGMQGLVSVITTNVREVEEDTNEDRQHEGMVAYYAAGIGVMFLLFSMAGAGGSILDEEESGTLERLLTSNVSMSRLLLSNWAFYGLLGFAQVIVMFIWAAFVFGLNLWTLNHLVGCVLLTVLTAAAAAAFGILLATLCRSRAQLGGMSTIIILIMSALGGSMVPRFVAPAVFDFTSRFTFNGWALDGYLNVFWYDDPSDSLFAGLSKLGTEAAVLVGMTVVFLVIARLVARRWDTI